jgi:actin-related protein
MTAIQERLKKMETFFDQKEFVVIDMGSGFIKAGFSGEDLPRVVIPTVVGIPQVQVDPTQ